MEFPQDKQSSKENENYKTHLSLNTTQMPEPYPNLIIPQVILRTFKKPDPLNRNNISYSGNKRISENKLIRPVPRRPFHHHPTSAKFKKNMSIEDNIMFKGPTMGIPSGNENSISSLINADTSHVKNLKNKKFIQSPGTTQSMGSMFNANFVNYENFHVTSNKCSPIPCLNGANRKSKLKLLNPFNNMENPLTSMGTFVFKPQTNNNLNIYNFPISDQKNFLAKRSLKAFKSSENLWNSFKNLNSDKTSKIINENVINNQICKSEEWKKNELHVRLKLSPACSENCDHNSLKSRIVKMLRDFKSLNENCLELSFDNSQGSSNNQFSRKLMDSACSENTPILSEGGNLSQNLSFGIIKNIVWNSFLRNNNNSVFKNQLEKVMEKVLNKLKNNNKLIYHKVNIFTLINLQIPMQNDKFHSLSSSVKLRVICMLFAKYVNRKPIIEMCNEFMEEIDLSMDHKDIKDMFIRWVELIKLCNF